MVPILIIDDEENLRSLMAKLVELEGYVVFQAGNAKIGWRHLEREDVHVVITDVRLPDANGLTLTSQIKATHPTVEVIVLTAYGTIADGVQAIKNGAFDYLTKGDHQDKLLPLLARAVAKAELQKKVQRLQQKLTATFGFGQVIGKSAAIRTAVDLAQKVATAESTVLLQGETGTGKEVFAQAIHYGSPRKEKPFVAFNCSAIAKDLLESELFGYAAGAFTQAIKDKRGLLEEANGGTLFLDEIGELNPELQAKLLRVLENGDYYRVGDPRVRKVNLRVIAATNRDLAQESEKGTFRSDLFYRLSVFQITLPPLRQRTEDIALLLDHFLAWAAAKNNKRIARYEPAFLQALETHPWKGNIRELKNIIERCVILCEKETLTTSLLPTDFNIHGSDAETTRLADMERKHIEKILTLAGGNKTKAAKWLDIGLTTLYQKIKDYEI